MGTLQAQSERKEWTRRERVWAVLRMQTSPWTHREIATLCEAPIRFVRSFVGRLLRVKYVRRTNPNALGASATFVLVKNTGPKPPSIVDECTVIDPNIKTTEAEVQTRIWNVLRKGEWTDIDDIVAETGAAKMTVRSYLNALTRAGILEERTPALMTAIRREKEWKLARDVGPVAPRRAKDGAIEVISQEQADRRAIQSLRRRS